MNKRQNHGITLIALVITIIILLILAGAAIGTLTSPDGIINKARFAVREYNISKIKEEIWLRLVQEEMGGKITDSILEDILNDYGEVQKDGDGNITGIITDEGYEIAIEDIWGGNTVAGEEPEENYPKIADKFENDNTGEIKIGDRVNYFPSGASATYTLEDPVYASSEATPPPVTMTRSGTTEGSNNYLGWRVLDNNGPDGAIRLISDAPTTNTVRLHGANGYNNAVKILDDLCSTLYGNTDIAFNVQSLKIEDIEDKLLWDDTTSSNYYSTSVKTNSTNLKYPAIYAKEEDQGLDGTPVDNNANGTTILGRSQQDGWYIQPAIAPEAQASWRPRHTYLYKATGTSNSGQFTEDIYHELFIYKGADYPKYWLGSRSVKVNADSTDFMVGSVYDFQVRAYRMYVSAGADTGPAPEASVRPVITLNPDVKVTGGNATTGWTIE